MHGTLGLQAIPGLSCSVLTCLTTHCSSSGQHLLLVTFITVPPPLHCCHSVLTLQVFYAMCQGLLYAFCYHLDTLLSRNDSEEAMSAAQLQHVHISDAVPGPGLHTSPSCMQPAAIRQTLSQLLPCILHHRCCSSSSSSSCSSSTMQAMDSRQLAMVIYQF